MLITIINHTPIWVWLLFLYLLRKGCNSLKPQIVLPQKTIILPAIFIILSLHQLLEQFKFAEFWLLGITVGIVSGYMIFNAQIKQMYLTAEQQTILPGSYNLLILLMTVFISHYLLAVLVAVNPAAIWSILNIAISGFTAGAFGFRAASLIVQQSRLAQYPLKN
ncbi:DUF6622 family protein [Celerinatantimonas diazotrophica]|uniref:DUF1453 domain-containing protein n=1 Tax=Celerinatantimonas diazotrophica TaxID=412034 RepID=A0A4R1J9Q5_9GAMM|nr:DUF6622 family protein [Celerinatantimonas diazotrophica]TCK47342.1 hypothetical protein EV690_2360 [Celerinatantimonas diazotrophica]CAG9295042.1 hypothetical protein CEDIAZO_00148 [Celerinatantimonas diazotrophica]